MDEIKVVVEFTSQGEINAFLKLLETACKVGNLDIASDAVFFKDKMVKAVGVFNAKKQKDAIKALEETKDGTDNAVI